MESQTTSEKKDIKKKFSIDEINIQVITKSIRSEYGYSQRKASRHVIPIWYEQYR